MHKGVALVAIAAAVALAACEQVSSILPASALECGGTEPELCRQVAQLGIAQMNLAATGPITGVAIEALDCAEGGRANFRDWRGATTCWSLSITGEKSHGWGFVVLWPNGDLEPFW
jgi:hypothetical protein